VRRITAKSKIRKRQDGEQPRGLGRRPSRRYRSFGPRSILEFPRLLEAVDLGSASSHIWVAPLLSMIGGPVSTTVFDRASRIPSERSIVDTAQAERIVTGSPCLRRSAAVSQRSATGAAAPGHVFSAAPSCACCPSTIDELTRSSARE
jgi:hypothetical protein